MLNAIVWLAAMILACVGFVQTAGYLAVRTARKAQKIYRVFPISGDAQEAGRQMALFYTAQQWEFNPSGQVYLLYDVGLGQGAAEECAVLARDTGAYFVRSPQELEEILKTGRLDDLQAEDSVL